MPRRTAPPFRYASTHRGDVRHLGGYASSSPVTAARLGGVVRCRSMWSPSEGPGPSDVWPVDAPVGGARSTVCRRSPGAGPEGVRLSLVPGRATGARGPVGHSRTYRLVASRREFLSSADSIGTGGHGSGTSPSAQPPTHGARPTRAGHAPGRRRVEPPCRGRHPPPSPCPPRPEDSTQVAGPPPCDTAEKQATHMTTTHLVRALTPPRSVVAVQPSVAPDRGRHPPGQEQLR